MTNSLHHQAELLEERFGLKIAGRLSESSDTLPADISERLRHARMQALVRRKQPQVRSAELYARAGNSAILGGPSQRPSAWQRLGMVLPILALLIGLVAINQTLADKTAQDLARVDTALLVDDLPPTAYADPGFLQFLRMQRAPTL